MGVWKETWAGIVIGLSCIGRVKTPTPMIAVVYPALCRICLLGRYKTALFDTLKHSRPIFT
jgi:hypothetical protein